MSGTLPKETSVPPLQLHEDNADSGSLSNGHETQKEQEEEAEEQEEEQKQEKPLPPGWSEGIDGDDVKFYWFVRDGKVSFDRPREEGSIHSEAQTARTNESLAQSSQTQKTLPSGAKTDRKSNQPVDEFEKLLRDQMFNRQLKDALQLGDKELLRAIVVRYEDSKPSGDRQRNEYDEDDDEDVRRENDDDISQTESDFNDAKELLKTIDYYCSLIRQQVRRGHWLQFISTSPEPGAGQTGGGGGRGRGAGGRGAGGRGAGATAEETQESRFHKMMKKFDRLSNLHQRQKLQQELEDEEWTRNRWSVERDPLRKQDVVNDIDCLLKRLRQQPDPPTPAPQQAKRPAHGAPRGPAGRPSGNPPAHIRHDRERQEEEEGKDAEKQRELQLLKRVRFFLRRQIDYLDLLGQALRPRDSQLPILAMDKKTMAEIRSYFHPKPIVHKVMQAALLLIGYDEATTAKWDKCKAACVPDGKDGLNRRLMKFQVDDLDSFIVERSWNILHRIRFDDVQKASPGAATFYVWASSILRMRGYSIDDDSLEGGLNEERMTQREIARREQMILRKPPTSSERDDYSYEGYDDDDGSHYPGAIYSI